MVDHPSTNLYLTSYSLHLDEMMSMHEVSAAMEMIQLGAALSQVQLICPPN